jgi:TetR/AcrR family transcriptional regulator, fatty acid biosynthesis regulator
VQTSRLTRKEGAELTRHRLIDSAIEILRREGVAAATTGRIARAAGLKQPSFYVHFADRDEIFRAAAAEIGRRMLEKLQRELAEIDPADVRGSIRAATDAMTAAFLSEPELTRTFLRHRTDDGTALGKEFGRLLGQARSQLLESLSRHGVAVQRETGQAYAELLVAGVLGLLEGLLEGRLRDRAAAVDAIAGTTSAMLRSLQREHGKERR